MFDRVSDANGSEFFVPALTMPKSLEMSGDKRALHRTEACGHIPPRKFVLKIGSPRFSDILFSDQILQEFWCKQFL